MRYRIKQNLLEGLIFISIILSSFKAFSQTTSVQIYSVKDYIVFSVDNQSDKTLYFENISFRNISKTCNKIIGTVKQLDTMYYSLKNDSLLFDYKCAPSSSWRWRVDSLRSKERKDYLIRLNRNFLKRVDNVEFLYYNDADCMSYNKTYYHLIRKKRWKQLRVK